MRLCNEDEHQSKHLAALTGIMPVRKNDSNIFGAKFANLGEDFITATSCCSSQCEITAKH